MSRTGKILFAIAMICLVTVGGYAWLAGRTYDRYEEMRKTVMASVLQAKAIDEVMEREIEGSRQKWHRWDKSKLVDELSPGVMAAAGFSEGLRGWIELETYEPPKFNWVNTDANQREVLRMALVSIGGTLSRDDTIWVDDLKEPGLAVVFPSETIMIVCENQNDEVLISRYVSQLPKKDRKS